MRLRGGINKVSGPSSVGATPTDREHAAPRFLWNRHVKGEVSQHSVRIALCRDSIRGVGAASTLFACFDDLVRVKTCGRCGRSATLAGSHCIIQQHYQRGDWTGLQRIIGTCATIEPLRSQCLRTEKIEHHLKPNNSSSSHRYILVTLHNIADSE